MEVSFSLTYKEGNEIRVSLSSFTETSIPDLIGYLGDAEIVGVSLVSQCGEDMADLATLSKVVERIGKFLIENPHVILYYYCDEMNEIPGMRVSRDTSSPEYRNHLFSLLYSKGTRQFPELQIVDMPIVFIGEDHKTFIHLIYREDLQDKADMIKDYLNDIAEGVK